MLAAVLLSASIFLAAAKSPAAIKDNASISHARFSLHIKFYVCSRRLPLDLLIHGGWRPGKIIFVFNIMNKFRKD
jgi:hypothetical protein